MVGKGALIVIIGFSMIFGIAGQYWNRTSNAAIENFSNYYDATAAHNLAISAANILADQLFWNQGDTLNLSSINIEDQSFGDGRYSMRTEPKPIDGENDILATAVGKYSGMRGIIADTVQILLQPGRFNQWAYFTNTDTGVYWTTGETMNGRYHTNGTLFIAGTPVFQGNVSTGRGLAARNYYNGAAHVINPVNPSSLPDRGGDRLIAASYQSGVTIPLPSTLTNYNQVPGVTIFRNNDTHSNYAYDVYMTFSPAGDPTKAAFHTSLKSVTETTDRFGRVTGYSLSEVSRVPAVGDSVVSITQFGDAGSKGLGSVVIIQNGDLHVSGNMDGRVTFVAQQGSTGDPARVSSSSYGTGSSAYDCYDANGGHANGNVVIEGNLTYAHMPADLNDSRNLLGLVADNSIMLASQTTQDLTIDGSLFARDGSFFYQNYASGSARGTLNIFGSLCQNVRGAVGTFGTSQTGYIKNYSYDQRFQRTRTSPPYSPTTGSYNIVAWRE